MSKKPLSFPGLLLSISLILQVVNNSASQTLNARLHIGENEAGVNGRFSGPGPGNLSFMSNFAGAQGISERILDLTLSDPQDKPVPVKRFMAGEYVADAPYTSWRYRVVLTPPASWPAAAHISWLTRDMGLLMMRDLLPQLPDGSRGTIEIEPPAGMTVHSSDDPNVADLDRAVFVVGRDLRMKSGRVNGRGIQLVMHGSWQFSDDDAYKLSAEIFGRYQQDIGPTDRDRYQITIAKFPMPVSPDNWEADTRGTSTVIISSDTPFKSQSIQRLHEQLRHEIFHFWFPNGVALTGSYDWFYEGFALYQSLKLGVAVNRISFDDYLSTLSRAYDMDRQWPNKMSLIEASQQRFNGGNSQVYARGMLVAFLCDLALLERSAGKTSVTGLIRDIYKLHRPPAAPQDGNDAVLEMMRRYPELAPIIDRNITGAGNVEWTDLLHSAGLSAEPAGSGIKLAVASKLAGRQKDLLDKLGYNNWRKLSKDSK